MKIIVQRVSRAQVEVNNTIVGKIKKGYLVLLGIHQDDDKKKADILVNKLINLRIMPDQNKKMNRSIKDAGGEVLVVSQFTLYADTSSRRPGFTKAASADKAKSLYKYFIQKLKTNDIKIGVGKFGAYMHISLINDGPVTIILEA